MKISEAFDFEDAEALAKYLISRAREDKLSVMIEASSVGFKITIEPLEEHLYLCPHYGKTGRN